MNSDTTPKYILNPKSNRYITYNGSLHRRLIKQGELAPVAFSQRTPVKRQGKKAEPGDLRLKSEPIKIPEYDDNKFYQHMKERIGNPDFGQRLLEELQALQNSKQEN
jgi:hypothetical protein